jgi:predicted alpha/beta-hydrolase family hydrolase
MQCIVSGATVPEPQPVRYKVPYETESLDAVAYRAPSAEAPLLILAHGAGAGQHSGFITAFAHALVTRGVSVTTFDFPYIQHGRKVPDRPPVLEGAWMAMLRFMSSQTTGGLFVGGKSMGGRIASQVLAGSTSAGSTWGPPSGGLVTEVGRIIGLVLLGYPLYPPGKPQQRRTAHLGALRVPTLIVQGARDAFGTATEVAETFAVCPAAVQIMRVEGGDHSFKVPGDAGPQRTVDERIRDAVAAWINERFQQNPG